MNISSAIVHARAGCVGQIRLGLQTIAGVEVHAVSEEGRLIVSIESDGDRETADVFETIQRLEGVLAAALVYSHCEADPDGELSRGAA